MNYELKNEVSYLWIESIQTHCCNLLTLINNLSSLNMEILTVAVFVYLILISILDFLIWFLRLSLVLVSMEKIYQSLKCFWAHFPTIQCSLQILRYAYFQLSSPCLVKHGLSYLIHYFSYQCYSWLEKDILIRFLCYSMRL